MNGVFAKVLFSQPSAFDSICENIIQNFVGSDNKFDEKSVTFHVLKTPMHNYKTKVTIYDFYLFHLAGYEAS